MPFTRWEAAVSAIESAAMKVPAAPGYFVDVPAPNYSEAGSETPAPSTTSTETSSDVAAPPRRPRKSRREETSPNALTTSTQHTTISTSDDAPANESAPTPPPFVEPAPIPAEKIVEVEPVAPASAEPFPVTIPPVHSSALDSAGRAGEHGHAPANGNASAPAPFVEPTPRKRTSRKPTVEPESELPLQLDSDEAVATDETPFTSAEMMEQVISSDGATRLIATSYIGIGNRLFIRCEGPGLSWEKGVPLQFVSIGKWRWETPDASAAVRFKLYKNDEVECPGLGTVELEPGHQQEVIAKF